VAIQGDGKIVTAGLAVVPGTGGDFALARYNTAAGSADLSVTKTAPARAKAGEPLIYTVTVTNTGPGSATGVVVTDDLPDTVTFQSADPGCSETGGVVTCNVGTLANGQTATVTITVVPTVRGTLVNTASVDSPGSDPDPTDDSASATTEVEGPKKPKKPKPQATGDYRPEL
jgi:uncharacterized repeat protein (TIGR01451 family)